MASGSAAARRLYLSLYNWVVFLGWAQVLYRAASALVLERSGLAAVYATEGPLLFAQTAAVMGVPSACGECHELLIEHFVPRAGTPDSPFHPRSPVSVTVPQISGRLYVTWGILWSFPEAQSHILVTSLILSWSISEIIRYSFFGMKETFGFAPSWLPWLRYSTFLVLYPIGLLSEVGLIFVAMPSMKGNTALGCLINGISTSTTATYASALLTALYVPGFPYLFRYMVAKRKKVLSAAKTA